MTPPATRRYPGSSSTASSHGVIVNQPGFAAAFKCTNGAPMNPGKQCGVW